MKKITLVTVILISMFLLTGCSKCVENHKETSICGGYWQPLMVGKVMSGYWVAQYPCEITICDKYQNK